MTPRGQLTDDEKRTIESMLEGGRKPGQLARIARRLKRPPGTIWFYATYHGLWQIKRRPLSGAYIRNGNQVVPFSNDEDTFITRRRMAGLSIAKIAAEATARFGVRRCPNSVRYRLISLAASEDAP